MINTTTTRCHFHLVLMSMDGYPVPRFDPGKLDDARGRRIVVVGKGRTGKTECVLDILSRLPHVTGGTVIVGREADVPRYAGESHRLSVQKADLANMTEEVRRQTDLMVGKKNLKAQTALVFDDCLLGWAATAGVTFQDLWGNTPYFRTSLILTLQYAHMPRRLSGGAHYVFICREEVPANRRLLYDYFAADFPTLQHFERVLDACTRGNDMLVIDNTVWSSDPHKCACWYRACAPATRIRAAARIQRAFRAWSWRRRELWNPGTEVGRAHMLIKFGAWTHSDRGE